MTEITAPKKRSKAKADDGFSEAERQAMKDRAAEVKRGKSSKADGEADLLAAIAKMSDADRPMAERIHAIIKQAAPELAPKTWYGMPAWARNDKVVCFFQDAAKFKARYATLGFNDPARLDDGTMWPTTFALLDLSPANEARIVALVKKAVG